MTPVLCTDSHTAMTAVQLATLSNEMLCAVWEYTDTRLSGPDRADMTLLRGLLIGEWDRRGLGEQVDAWFTAVGDAGKELSPRPFLA